MTNDRDPKETPEPVTDSDEIEILEIVGLGDESDDGASTDPDEVVVTFDGEPLADVRPIPVPSAADSSDAQERILRLRADFENLKKRVERERDDVRRHATAALVLRLLPVLDNLERALAIGRQRMAGDALYEGIVLVHRQFLEELRKDGLRPIECLGRPFDPSEHEAVATETTSGLPSNIVVEELQRGYYFENRVLRPALVRVSLGVPGGGGSEDRREDS